MLFPNGDERARRSGDDRRGTILEAAIRIIGHGGPDAITHRAVAARARVPLGSVTYYFDSREELVREAFRYYLGAVMRFLATLEQETSPESLNELADFLVEVTRREFMEPELARAEYELILYAARDESLAREFNAYERSLEIHLAARLERMGAARPIDSARTVIDLVRGFELERFTHPGAEFADLRRRLLPVLEALTASAPPHRAGRAFATVTKRDSRTNVGRRLQ
ncbi:MAG: TetR/AcrR family transcriptional regulator [Candidatus Binataceae bacterium]